MSSQHTVPAVVFMGLASIVALDGAVTAGPTPDRLLPPASQISKPGKPPAMAAREAQKRYGGGKVLNVENAIDGYHVKLLLNGDVRVVFIPYH
ncbi:MAG: hypothetical protein ACT4P0_03100 [Panacagrimonas sp.]